MYPTILSGSAILPGKKVLSATVAISLMKLCIAANATPTIELLMNV
jgi:hypothetical protein